MKVSPRDLDSSNAGFTLVELIVGLALLALLFAAITGSIRFATIATTRAATAGDVLSVHAANQFMRSTLSRAIPLFVRGGPRELPRLVFHGSPTSVRFVANMPGRVTVAGVHEITFKFVKESPTGNLMASMVINNSFQVSKASEKDLHSRPLVQDVQSLEFAYFGAVKRGEAPVWHARWQNRKRLPERVSFALKFGATARDIWPETIIRLVHQRPSR